jgi:hypothetical protein
MLQDIIGLEFHNRSILFTFVIYEIILGRSNGIPKSVLLATRVTPRINDHVKQAANREGLYVSEWIRQLVTRELKEQGALSTGLRNPLGTGDQDR